MNASAAHILYLIDADGNIGIPNTSENSLSNVQGAFQTGERFRISSKTVGSGPADQFRTVIRGGSRIEPILYSQYQAAPNQQWNTTMSFEDIIPSTSGNTNNYLSTNTPPVQSGGANTWQTMDFTWQVLGTLISTSTSKYIVPSGVISDGVTLKFYFNRSFTSNDTDGSGTFSLNFRITKKRGSSYTYYPNENGDDGNPSSDFTPINLIALTNNSSVMKGNIEISPTDLATGDEIYIEYIENNSLNGKTLSLPNGAGYFKVTQYPSPTSPITSSGYNSIWNWGDANNYPYIITSSNQTLVDIFDETAKQTDITGSGFNPVSLPFSIKYGDEFRFEGREDFTYMVSKVFAPAESEGRIFPTGSIEVHFGKNLPTGSSSSTLNLDHFLIRRYVDSPSQILMEGQRPINSQGPYILIPEYSTKDLSTNIDDVITDLKERGLITGEEGS